MSCSIAIETVSPEIIEENEPFKVTWSVALPEVCDTRSVTVTFLTDDARLMLYDHGSHESPPERLVNTGPGQRLTKTTTLQVQRRKGLIDETSRDGTSSPFFLLMRVRNDRDQIIASGAGIEVHVAGLSKRTAPRIFA